MQLETFRGRDMRALVRHVSHFLGDNAMVVRTKVLERSVGNVFEVVAAHGADVDAFQRRLDGGPPPRTLRGSAVRPYVIALVGPAGSGKTTTSVKLALNTRGVGAHKVGFVTLDTYRVGAVEQLQTYAEIANLPLEIVYHAREVPVAMERLRDCEIVIVDTPGRWFETSDWLESLTAFAPDEVHLVLPAGLRIDVAKALQARMSDANVSHVLLTKVDELPNEAGLADLASALGLPTRWLADGTDVPEALAPASPRIMGALGVTPGASHAVAI